MKQRLIIICLTLSVLLITSISAWPAIASTTDNLFGWAWNPVIGWVSFNNCQYAGACIGIDYGVNLEISGSYNLSGYAWNSNVGWILFSNNYPGGGYPQHGAQLDLNDRKFNGWAKILSLGDNGWIKLAKDSYDGGSPDYWTRLQEDGRLAGWAWNNMIGWLSFNSTDTTSSITYYVTGQAPTVPVDVTVVPDSLDGCDTLFIDWQDSLYAENYSVFRSTSSSFTPTTTNFISPDVSISNRLDNGLALNTGYYYHIGANNFFGTTYTPLSTYGKTRPICGINTITGQGDCLDGDPSVIKLQWQVPTVAPGIEIAYYNIKRCQVEDSPTGDDCAQSGSTFVEVASFSDCYQVDPGLPDNPPTPPPSNHCSGIDCHCWEIFSGEEVAEQYVYKIIAVDTDGNSGDDTATLVNIYPCARQKSWRWEEQNPGI